MTLPVSKLPEQPRTVAQFPLERMGDAELVQMAADGDGRAVGVIWDRYSALVRRVLRGALGPDHAVEDLLQEVFVAFLRGASRIENAAALRGYLTGVAVRQAALELRRRKVRRWVTLTPTGEVPELPLTPTDNEGREALKAFYRVLDRMGNRERMVFVLRQIEGMEFLEIVEVMGISESTVRRALSAAKAHLEISLRREPALAGYLRREEGELS